MPTTMAEPPTTKLLFFPSKSPKMPTYGGKKFCATAIQSILQRIKNSSAAAATNISNL
ncbi:MAG: hypothetical protein RLP44_26235 [Aggregatilineales bacterium]